MIFARATQVVSFLMVLLLSACLNYADYSLEAYTHATEVKAKTLALLGKTGQPYSKHQKAAEEVLLAIDVAYEFANGIEHNNEAAQMWRILRDENRTLAAGLIRRWRVEYPKGVPVGNVFFDEAESNLADAFNRLICLEVNKREPTKCPKPVE